MAVNYDSIKRTAKQTGVGVADLCALSPNNDPFYVGRPSAVQAAEWFARLWSKFGYGQGVHLRRIHYQACSTLEKKPNGTVYENSLNDWGYLMNAGKWARYLGLVDAAAFVDRRNFDPVINAYFYDDGNPRTYLDAYYVDMDFPEYPTLPSLETAGFEGNRQPYLVEVWAEKTTMNDVLEPLCRDYNVNFVTGKGELSVTTVVEFLKRVTEANRPAVILYVSDYDAAGVGMPISVARKIEYFLAHSTTSLSVTLQPVVLTKEQVDKYDLPRIPCKDSDRRKDNWEGAHGEGQVELDALEALYPDELAKIIEREIEQYIDQDIRDEARRVERKVAKYLAERAQEIIGEYTETLDSIEERYDEIKAEFEKFITEVLEDFKKIHAEVAEKLGEIEVPWEDFEMPVSEVYVDPDDKMFDSERGYMEQLREYKRFREGRG